MNRSFFYLSHDPVNEHWARRWAEERGGTFYPLSLRDPLPDGECRLLIRGCGAVGVRRCVRCETALDEFSCPG